ncbi:hypothetical protein FANTH_7919 [Fusarium anthophilum]|uniref:Uncharacterized protein n=1 Tax=Fusarium anthophilum TaxID=48485 RepID=A0A8H4ZDE5_9HYPO|nr:hypothetical protein FANTH_7919 [Fusarium anthophilum]
MEIDRDASRDLSSLVQTQSPRQLTRKVTPPARQALPPSPPSTAEAKRVRGAAKLPAVLIALKCKVEDEDIAPLTCVSLSPTEYSDAWEHIESERDFRKFDYEPAESRFTLRMPSTTHEAFSTAFTICLYERLLKLGPRDLKEMLCRQPDGQFQYRGAPYPGVAFEVSYSQDGKKLTRIAKEYINYSNGNIKAVVCIDINNATESTVSLWKARLTPADDGKRDLDFDQTIKSAPFRTADGKRINSEKNLTLQLHDFVPDELYDECPDFPVAIMFSKLFELLSEAEEMQKSRELGDVDRTLTGSNVRKRRISSSSIEELDADDETRFRDQEQAIDDKA